MLTEVESSEELAKKCCSLYLCVRVNTYMK